MPRKPPVFPPDTRSSLLKAIQDAASPQTPAQLAKCVKSTPKLTGPLVKGLLGTDLTPDGIFNWASDKSPLYWHREPAEEARTRLLKISAEGPVARTKLATLAAKGPPKIGSAIVRLVLDGILGDHRLCLVKTKGVMHTDAWLKSEIARMLKSVGWERPTSRIQALLASEPEDETVREVAAKIFDAMNRIAFSPGTTVTFYRLRQQPELAHIPKAIFDEAALLLQQERKALLSLHGHAAALPEEERESFVTDGLGTYYVSIFAR